MITPRGIAYRQFFIALVFLGTALLMYRALQSEYVYDELLDRPYKTWRWDSNIDFPNLFELPYPSITKKDLSRWDADHYHNIAMEGYGAYSGTYAFFPLFPWLYRLFGGNPYLICIVNWLLFAVGWIFLLRTFTTTWSPGRQLAIYTLGVAFPFAVVFGIPHTEAVYFVAGTLFLIGLFKQKPLLWALGGFMLGMSRPAIMIVMVALVCVELLKLLLHLKPGRTLKNIAVTTLPILAGMTLVVIVQMQTGSPPLKFMTVQSENWGHGFAWPGRLWSWSHSGQMLELLAIFGIGLAALWQVVRTAWHNLVAKYLRKLPVEQFELSSEAYLELFISASIVGQAIVIIFWQHAGTHGAPRYIFTTPFFYLWAIIQLKKLWAHPVVYRLGVWGALIAATYLAFYLLVGDKLFHPPKAAADFPFNGAPWMFLNFFAAFMLPDLPRIPRIIVFVLAFLTAAFYCSFLLMCFIGNGLIWT